MGGSNSTGHHKDTDRLTEVRVGMMGGRGLWGQLHLPPPREGPFQQSTGVTGVESCFESQLHARSLITTPPTRDARVLARLPDTPPGSTR